MTKAPDVVIGKYLSNEVKPFQATAICDRSGFKVMHKDLRKQYEWAGNKLVWTGLMVHKDFVDPPTEQLKVIPPKSDPKPIVNARPNIDADLIPYPNERVNLSFFNWQLNVDPFSTDKIKKD